MRKQSYSARTGRNMRRADMAICLPRRSEQLWEQAMSSQASHRELLNTGSKSRLDKDEFWSDTSGEAQSRCVLDTTGKLLVTYLG